MNVRKFLLKKFPTNKYFDCPVPKHYYDVMQEYAEAYHDSKVKELNLTTGFCWHTRYSQTEEPDKQGRWARLCFYRKFLIAWISRQQVDENIIYVVTDYFPSNGNSNPRFVGATEDFEKAKEGVEKRFSEFLEDCC